MQHSKNQKCKHVQTYSKSPNISNKFKNVQRVQTCSKSPNMFKKFKEVQKVQTCLNKAFNHFYDKGKLPDPKVILQKAKNYYDNFTGFTPKVVPKFLNNDENGLSETIFSATSLPVTSSELFFSISPNNSVTETVSSSSIGAIS